MYHICHKNCHKYCKFQDLWENEHALLLSLEDIGLMTEQFGYPYQKRLELQINVQWNSNNAMVKYRNDHGESQANQESRLVTLRTICVYENGQFIGDVRRSEFVEKYM